MAGFGRFLKRTSRLVVVSTVGFALLAAGIALSLPGVPGPGLLLAVAGLAVLSTEFAWARRMRERLRESLAGLRDRFSHTDDGVDGSRRVAAEHDSTDRPAA